MADESLEEWVAAIEAIVDPDPQPTEGEPVCDQPQIGLPRHCGDSMCRKFHPQPHGEHS